MKRSPILPLLPARFKRAFEENLHFQRLVTGKGIGKTDRKG
jgi:hypothetical protein